MSDDLDKLRAAWTADPSPEAEIEVSRRLWKRALWRMRLWNVFEGVALLLLAAYLATWIAGDASSLSAVLALFIIALLWWSQRKRYLLRSAELGAIDPERVGVLRREMARVRARLIRNLLAIGLIVPLFGLGFLLGQMRDPAMPPPEADMAVPAWLHSPIGKWLAIALLVFVIMTLAQALLRDRRVLANLASRLEEYRAEYLRDEAASPNGQF